MILVVVVSVVVVIVVVLMMVLVTYGKDRKGHCKGDEGCVTSRDAVWST